jgi:hypothetical protein
MRILFVIFILLSQSFWAQTESLTSITVGANIDFTVQPIVPQQEFSHSQTIYYPNQLQFGGTINEIRYTTAFSNSNFTNSTEWIVKIGLTDVYEFQSGDPFITTGLTEVFNGTFTSNASEIIIPFITPFYYDGVHNLVIDVAEVGVGYTSSSLTVFTALRISIIHLPEVRFLCGEIRVVVEPYMKIHIPKPNLSAI